MLKEVHIAAFVGLCIFYFKLLGSFLGNYISCVLQEKFSFLERFCGEDTKSYENKSRIFYIGGVNSTETEANAETIAYLTVASAKQIFGGIHFGCKAKENSAVEMSKLRAISLIRKAH